jgi:riboflavin synthase
MFTGCINHCGKITDVDELSSGKRFRIACDYTDLVIGESIAVNGVCLTVVQCIAEEFSCDISPETLAVSSMRDLNIGHVVNLERSLRVSDRLNGHFVMGHVDQVCRVAAKQPHTDYVEYRFNGLLPAAKPFFVTKGSVAVNGVSLTLNSVKDDTFSVMLIPETLRITNLSTLNVGNLVNVEYDYLAKVIAQRER